VLQGRFRSNLASALDMSCGMGLRTKNDSESQGKRTSETIRGAKKREVKGQKKRLVSKGGSTVSERACSRMSLGQARMGLCQKARKGLSKT
jgi:hypothetical protein